MRGVTTERWRIPCFILLVDYRKGSAVIWRDLRFQLFDFDQVNIDRFRIFNHSRFPPGTVKSQTKFSRFRFSIHEEPELDPDHTELHSELLSCGTDLKKTKGHPIDEDLFGSSTDT